MSSPSSDFVVATEHRLFVESPPRITTYVARPTAFEAVLLIKPPALPGVSDCSKAESTSYKADYVNLSSRLTIIICRIILGIILFILYLRRPAMSTHTARRRSCLPADLLAAVDQAVQAGQARSRNEFVARALQRELAAQ